MKRKSPRPIKLETLSDKLFEPLAVAESKRLVGGMIKLVTKTEQPDGKYTRDDD